MSLIKPQKVEELIVKRLKNGPVLTLDLVQKIKQDRPNTTKQAVYAAVRKMKAEEMILTVKGASSLNMTWINEMITYLDLAKRHYVNKGSQGSILDMEDGERIKYYFTDSHRGDIFWTHAYFLLLENLASDEPVFLYNPHEWFLLAREENERSVIRSTVSAGHLFLLTACGETFLDKHIRKQFDGTDSQYNLLRQPLFPDTNYYLNIFGDYLIEVWLDKKVAADIESLYRSTGAWSESVSGTFRNILELNGRLRMVISRNHAKAERLKKMFRKGFAIPKRKTTP